jgi:drug/metabolite transporter (DMT)-like permease
MGGEYKAMNEASRAKLIAAFAAVYVIWGSTYLAIRFGVETLPPFMMAGMRFIVSGIAMYVWARSRGVPAPGKREWRSAAIIGVLLLSIGNGGVTWAEQYVPSGLTALFIATMPLWFVIVEWLMHKTGRPSARVLGGLVVGFVGMLMLIGPDQILGHNRIHLGGLFVLLVAEIGWAFGSIYSKRAELPSSPVMATAMEMIAGSAVLFLVSGVSGEFGRFDFAAVTGKSWLAVGYLSVFGSIVAFTAYVWLLRSAPASHVATYAYVNPIIAIILGWALAGEQFTTEMLLAAGVIILGVVLIIGSQPANSKARKSKSEGESKGSGVTEEKVAAAE